MAKDVIHQTVRAALEKDHWTITNDPFTLQTGDISLDIDLAAEKFLVAEKHKEKILVEIKSFGSRSWYMISTQRWGNISIIGEHSGMKILK